MVSFADLNSRHIEVEIQVGASNKLVASIVRMMSPPLLEIVNFHPF
jgi:hypothetical protein